MFPAIVTVPVLGTELALFAATVNVTVPVPLWLPERDTVIQDTLLVAAHVHVVPEVVTLMVPVPPVYVKLLWLAAETV